MTATANDTAAFVAQMLDSVNVELPRASEPEQLHEPGDPSVSAVRPIMRNTAAAETALPSDTVLEQIPPELVLKELDEGPLPLPAVATDDDAYFHPGGRIKTVAEAGWQSNSAAHVIRPPVKKESQWLVLGLVAMTAPLLFLFAIVMVGKLAPAQKADRGARLHSVDDQKFSIVTTAGDHHDHRVAPQPRSARRSKRH